MELTKAHRNIDVGAFEAKMKQAIRCSNISSYKSLKVFRILYDMATFIKFREQPSHAFILKDDKYKIFDAVFERIPEYLEIYDMTILMYNILKRNTKIDLTSILGELIEIDAPAVKETDFTYTTTFKLLKNSNITITPDMLVFMDKIAVKEETSVKKMTSISRIVKVANICDYVKPDLGYKIASNNLNIRDVEIQETPVKRLYVIQDASLSMRSYKDKLFAIKSLILDRCASTETPVEWITASSNILSTEVYDTNYIPNKEVAFKGVQFNLSHILSKDKFVAAKVVIITDGTDSLEKLFTPKTSDISILSFNENLNIKKKINQYGKIFKV